MNVTPTCFSKECRKPRFLDFYVCAEHFAYYVAPRYTESMVIKVEPLIPSNIPAFTSELTSCNSANPKHATQICAV
jgi:hypothetical protein